MGWKSKLSKPFANFLISRTQKRARNPERTQEKVFRELLKGLRSTSFGKDHGLEPGLSYERFREQVPIRDYEGLRPYIDRILKGERDVLWPGKPMYLAKTAGTTSGAKYIPITRDSMPNHLNSARNALLSYIADTGRADFVDGKMIFLQGSPEVEHIHGIPTGRLSGIVADHVPNYLKRNRMPSYETNCIDDWEEKLERIIDETIQEDMRLISGIPSWVQMYFERLQERTGGKTIREIFPNFSLLVYGGVNYEPYRGHFEKLIGGSVDSIELYPCSEGFLAYQDRAYEKGMLLIIDAGIFYEFVPADEIFNEDPTRLKLTEVEKGVNYAVIINSNAGLWGYNIGDTVEFVSTDPYRVIVTGRIKHFTSAFGEHVIAHEVEGAMQKAIQTESAEVVEFTVAPQMETPGNERPYHEWFIEFARKPENIYNFRQALEQELMNRNVYYKELIEGGILQPLRIRFIKRGGFNAYMASKGKLGGQNKVPHLADDRRIVDDLVEWEDPITHQTE